MSATMTDTSTSAGAGTSTVDKTMTGAGVGMGAGAGMGADIGTGIGAGMDVADKIKERLRVDQWTSRNVNEVTINDFKSLDEVIGEVDSEQDGEGILQILEEQLARAPKNISALYGTSIIKLRNKSIDDSQLVKLLDMFRDHKRWGLLEHLCNTFLEYGDNRHILRTLASCYEETQDEEKRVIVWEKLVKIDFSETDIVLRLAEEYAGRGMTAQAIEFYKKLILRSISNGVFTMVHTGWGALASLVPENIEFFMQVENSVGKKFSSEQGIMLLEQLYPIYKKLEQWDNAIVTLKHILSHQPESMWGRKELVLCYREKYGQHRNLDEFLKSANINQSWRNIHEAIADFEKHISFDENNFVFHRTWGVGVIREITRDNILIDFSKNKKHIMSLKMAMTALEILPKNHIWVLRSVIPPEKLKEMVKNHMAQALRIIIQSFGNAVTMKKIRAELVPYVLTEAEWTGWNVKARRILKTDGGFGTIADLSDHYEVRTQRSSFIEKAYNSFSAEKDFANRAKIVLEFLKLPEAKVQDSNLELLREITNYFTTYIHLKGEELVLKISSLLILRLLNQKFPPLQIGHLIDGYSLVDLISSANAAFLLYQQIETKDLRNYFLSTVSEELSEDIWVGTYLRILEDSPSKFVLDKLVTEEKYEPTVEAIKRVYTNYRTHREAFIWLVAHAPGYERLLDALPDEQTATIAMTHLYDINAADINNKRYLSASRKNQRQIHKYLYKEERLVRLVGQADEMVIVQLIPILNELQRIEPVETIVQKEVIAKRFPHLKQEMEQQGRTQAGAVKQSGFFTLDSSYHAKQRELRHIHEVEVPQNSKEIQKALELGDLRENAEYKSAKERQDILNANAMRLDNEIRQAKVLQPEKFEQAQIGFGTRVLLTDLNDNKEVSYTIFGPWESDPNKNIISYLSPLGAKLTGHTAGSEIGFAINDIQYKFRVEKITRAAF